VGGNDRHRRQAGDDARDLRIWVRRVEIDDGKRPGTTTDDQKKIKDLEREVKELKRANEILKDASIFFATELDGRTKR
jgi:transposase